MKRILVLAVLAVVIVVILGACTKEECDIYNSFGTEECTIFSSPINPTKTFSLQSGQKPVKKVCHPKFKLENGVMLYFDWNCEQ